MRSIGSARARSRARWERHRSYAVATSSSDTVTAEPMIGTGALQSGAGTMLPKLNTPKVLDGRDRPSKLGSPVTTRLRTED
jgi:hypothetical protein